MSTRLGTHLSSTLFRGTFPTLNIRRYSGKLIKPSTNGIKMAEETQESVIGETLKIVTEGPVKDVKLAKKSISARLKEGALHYWHGSKLLAYETKISTKLLVKLLKGDNLIRRERRQLVRTTSDLIRLVPFVVIAVIPFLEFALPVLLKMFPNMLPSTFEDRLAAEEKTKKLIKVKLEMAKFLQETMEAMVADGSLSPGVVAAREFSELFKKARITGGNLSIDELVRVCQSLKDSLTVDNLDRPQLVSLCRYMNIKAFGTDSFLRYQIRKSLKNLYHDDVLIQKEGVNSLDFKELTQACHMRGIPFSENQDIMRRELNYWLELHLNQGIPSVLLILSRAFSAEMTFKQPEEALKETLLSLPESIVNEAELHQDELAGSDAVSFKRKLEVLEKQEELIAEELAQDEEIKETKGEVEVPLSKDDLKTLKEAITVLSSPDPAEQEKKELEELKADVVDYKEEARELESVTDKKLKEPKGASMIGEKVEELIHDLEFDIQNLQKQIGSRLNIIQANQEGSITTGQLEMIFNMIKRKPDTSEKLDTIIKKFDADGDGKILLSDIMNIAKEAQEEEGHGVVIKESEASPSESLKNH